MLKMASPQLLKYAPEATLLETPRWFDVEYLLRKSSSRTGQLREEISNSELSDSVFSIALSYYKEDALSILKKEYVDIKSYQRTSLREAINNVTSTGAFTRVNGRKDMAVKYSKIRRVYAIRLVDSNKKVEVRGIDIQGENPSLKVWMEEERKLAVRVRFLGSEERIIYVNL